MKEFRDVEDLLVWAFRDQKVEAFANSFRPKATGWSSMSSLGQLMVLGTRVDSPSAGARFVGARCHEDATVIFEAVMALPSAAWVEIIKHARGGSVPEWHEDGPGEFVVPLDRNGQPKRLWHDPVRQRGDMGPAPAELVGGPPPDIVEEDRAIYRLWHVTMCELVPMLNAEMQEFGALPPRRPAEPWLMPVRQLHEAC
jgi:hypothetical protein